MEGPIDAVIPQEDIGAPEPQMPASTTQDTGSIEEKLDSLKLENSESINRGNFVFA